MLVCACVRARVYALRIVFAEKIFRFIDTFNYYYNLT